MNLILGTMTFGQQVEVEDASEMVKCYCDAGYSELDTAYVYNGGLSEKIIGEIIPQIGRDNLKIATKVNPRITGRLDAEAVENQFNGSLNRMGVSKVDTLYLHFPDPKTPVESALEACARLYEDGKFTELGLSNFPAWLVVDVYYKCLSHGWMLPTLYEGVYNALSRKAETELFSALRAFDMRFTAYNPLAGGMLSGKYSDFAQSPAEGRFTYRPNYQNRYWKESYFKSLDIIRKACSENDVSMVDAAYRWISYHSMLDVEKGDGIIIGASKLAQLKQNIASVEEGELPSSVIDAFNKAWEICKVDAPEYFKFYSP